MTLFQLWVHVPIRVGSNHCLLLTNLWLAARLVGQNEYFEENHIFHILLYFCFKSGFYTRPFSYRLLIKKSMTVIK